MKLSFKVLGKILFSGWFVLGLIGCGTEEVQPPPAPVASPGGDGGVSAGTPGGAPPPSVNSPGSGPTSPSATLPPSADPLLSDREKFRMKKREEARKQEEEDKKRTLIVTENPIFDSKLGRRDPFAEVNPYNQLSPLVGFHLNAEHYRVSGLAKQGNVKRAVIQIGLDTTNVPTTRSVEEGEGFFEGYTIKGNQLSWKGRPVVDGQVLPTGEVVDEVKIRQSMVLVTEINFENQYVVLRELPTDKYPARQVKLSLQAFATDDTGPGRGASGPINVGGDSQNDDYIRYLEEKAGGKEGSAEDFGSFLQSEKTKREGKGKGSGQKQFRNEPGMPPANAPPPPKLPGG